MADPDIPPLIVIGASAGGVETLTSLVRRLEIDVGAAIAVVLHIPPQSASVLAEILDRAGPLPARQASDGEPLEAGRIYVAPPDRHLVISDAHVSLSSGPRENGHRPAIDALFNSAARVYGPRAIGMVLSGTLDDGAAGLAQIKLHNGVTLVQDPADALYPPMPAAALARVRPDFVGSVDELARVLPEMVRHLPLDPMSGEDDPPDPTPDHEHNGNELAAGPDMPEGGSVGISCPECGGALWVVGEPGTERFRCRIGHAYSDQSLMVEHARSLEAALWTALRALEERSALLRRMAQRSRGHGHERSAARFEGQADELQGQADTIRDHILPEAVAGPDYADQA